MSLNNIELNPRLLAELYSNMLVSETDGQTIVAPPPATEPILQEHEATLVAPAVNLRHDFKSLGNNQKNVLVAVYYNDVVHLPDAQLNFLANLLKACNLSLEDVALINMNHYNGIDYNQILTHFKSNIVLLFGMTSQDFGFPFEIPEYQLQRFADRTIIHSAALHSIQDDKEAKGRLWAGLKKIFNL